MLVHAMLGKTRVNGPGTRAAVWFQGCNLRCPGCWNQLTHAFDPSRDMSVEDVGEWILACLDVEGVTFSGGEPLQQAPDLSLLCKYLKERRPGLSIGLFSGYTLVELSRGQWHWRSLSSGEWMKGDANLFERIKQHLDFGILGRFRQDMACGDKPLCGSRNQEVIFFSDRYSELDLSPQACELTITQGGRVTITGFPPARLFAARSMESK